MVLDAMAGDLSLAGLDSNSDTDVERWWQEVGNFFCRPDCALLDEGFVR